MVIAALLVIPVIWIDSAKPGEPLDSFGQVLNWLTWLAFRSMSRTAEKSSATDRNRKHGLTPHGSSRHARGATHNPSVGGSSPPRPIGTTVTVTQPR
jgi:hypothetical protein